MVAGGAAIAAAAAYGIYRYRDVTKDRVISPNRMIQTVHQGDMSERMAPGNPFYASYTRKDNAIYASRVFSHFGDKSNVTYFYTKDGIRAASEKTGRKIFDELVETNPEVAAYSKRMGHFKDGRKAYERFNYSLVLRNNSETAKKMGVADLDHDKVHKIFYDELKKRGYGAVIDVNDSRREGFTFNPVIVFDDQVKHVIGTAKASAGFSDDSRTLEGIRYASRRKVSLNPVKSPGVLLGGYSYLYSLGVTNNNNKELNQRIEFIDQYMKDHPNTKLTRSQIAERYDQYS